MLPTPLSWNPNSSELLYSSETEQKRKLYLFDIYTEVSRPISFYQHDWFEVQFIHPEQAIIHVWKNGIYIYDTEKKHAQKMISSDLCRFFYYNKTNKKLLYNNQKDAYLYDPVTIQNKKICDNSTEFLIDPLHQTFISITSSYHSKLNIFYKNKVIFSEENTFNIFVTPDYEKLIYFKESEKEKRTFLHILDLNILKKTFEYSFTGFLQSTNIASDSILINLKFENTYCLFMLHLSQKKVRTVEIIEHPNLIYSSLAPNKSLVAILKEYKKNSMIELIELDNIVQNL